MHERAHAAQVFDEAHGAVAAARAARDRTRHRRVERMLARLRTDPVRVGPRADATLRAMLCKPDPTRRLERLGPASP